MEFIETSFFTKRIGELLEDEEYGALQAGLAANPGLGKLIPSSHGLRKVRWPSQKTGSGKRGGIRVIYYLIFANKILMLFAYTKNRQHDLSGQQLRILRQYVEREVS